MTRRMWLIVIAYIVIGVIVATSHHYFTHLDGLKQLASALFAILRWPLVLIGVNLRIK
jgi:thiamine monophosphate synthase